MTDDICESVEKKLPEDERQSKFPFPSFSGTASENVHTSDELVDFQYATAKALRPELDRIVEETLSNGESAVIEGVHLLPEQVRELSDRHPKNIRAVFVGSEDIGRIIDGIMRNTSPDNWTRDSDSEVVRQIAEFASIYSGLIRKEAEANDLPYIERTDNFEKDMKSIVEAMTSH
ncbi:hypothetical protein KJ925_02810 [Patescibacteria group bacterium]|nr:hypothetical protein [Patescibacteria group bacterium]